MYEAYVRNKQKTLKRRAEFQKVSHDAIVNNIIGAKIFDCNNFLNFKV